MMRVLLVSGIAFALLSTGLIHLVQPYYFLQSLAAFRILPAGLLLPTGIVIPCLHISVAMHLMRNLHGRPAGLAIAAVLFGIYAAALTVVLYRGDEISCRCFGVSSPKVSLLSLLAPLSGFVVCTLLLFRFDSFGWKSDSSALSQAAGESVTPD